MRFSRLYFVWTLCVLAVEVGIAHAPTGSLVRSYLGDTLAVVLLYTALLSVRPMPRGRAALYAFGCSCGVELAQAFEAVERLGLGHVPLARVVIGTRFDPFDLLAYGAGLALLLLAELAAFTSNYGAMWAGLRTKSRHRTRPPGTLTR